MKPRSQIEISLNGALPELIKVEGGKFMMGSNNYDDEQPIHEVEVPDFHIGKYPITNEQFLPFLQEVGNQEEEGTSWVNLNGAICGIKKQYDIFHCVNGLERYPMIYLSWYGAKAYCKWLSGKTGHSYRLPSEAEWEYAARGGKYNLGCSYAGSNKLKEVAWYTDNSHNEPKPVGMKIPNELGLYDMSGNVFEWCEDHWHDSYHEAPKDGSTWGGDKENVVRVDRGGSWLNSISNCRVSYRNGFDHNYRYINVGFRIARY